MTATFQRRAETKKGHNRDGWVMVAWGEQKPKLYIYNIYIQLFIYLLINFST